MAGSPSKLRNRISSDARHSHPPRQHDHPPSLPSLDAAPMHQQHRHRPSTSISLASPSPAAVEAGTASKHAPVPPAAVEAAPPTWSNMPHKAQLAILFLSRFVDFFQMAALQTFMIHQLHSFAPALPDATISYQAGLLQSAFTASQVLTSILWGRAADHPHVGRKLVLQVGLVGTAAGCLGNAFARSFAQAVACRLLSGALNGTVGAARTMLAERTPPPWHPRAFLLLPAAFNFANVLAPILAGTLADPLTNLPGLFGPGSALGGPTGVTWMSRYPYALPHLASSAVLLLEAAIVHAFLRETLPNKRPFPIARLHPRRLALSLSRVLSRARSRGYHLLPSQQPDPLLLPHPPSIELDRLTPLGRTTTPPRPRLPFRRIWTPNVLWVLLSVAIFDFHMGAFTNLWILFLATPRPFTPPNTPSPPSHSLLKFASGLAFPPPTIGLAMSIIGFLGVALQFLLYPYAAAKFGLMPCFRASLLLFPLAYILAPYIALLPSASPPPLPASGPAVWTGIAAVLLAQVAARTFALPATILLINNASPHPSVLASVHGIGQACSAVFRSVGPVLAAHWFAVWHARGISGMAWWLVAAVAAAGWVASFRVRNGSGHEIFLPGDDEEEEGKERAGGSADGR